ncbi:glycoside hydrolase family 5 protein [Arthrobacter sp. HY1533]|uniref:glycoside hydrolase family 5 protein n=1 Tax=Arthrobacter sp. HY1533 TaxID=2970919 RepID=UPI0022BA0349|nr:cellulase family glycosylhydrolase [Arthrobacter sp. HY1533]
MQGHINRVAVGLSTIALAAVSLVSPANAAPADDPIQELTGAQLAASWTAPLSTRGRYIVDANGTRFKLKSANWDGAQGHWNGTGSAQDPANSNSGMSYDIPMGLDRVALPTLMADFHKLGINSIRLPFSNEMLGKTAPVPDAAVTANPALKGKTPLQVFDVVVKALTDDGFAVILNNHTTTSRWCCGADDGNSKWYSSQTTDKWISDWVMLAARYQDNPRVVGMDLRNEVRRDIWDDPNWGLGDGNDLYKAYQLAGIAIQKTNPNVLVVMEGINWQGIPTDATFHDRPQLKPVANISNTILYPDKVVYAMHVYGFTGPRHTGATGLGETTDPRYRDLSAAELAAEIQKEALFVYKAGQHYTAPVWVSEFGTTGAGQTDAKEVAWWTNFTDILAANDTDFAAWPLVTQASDTGVFSDKFALLAYKADGTKLSIADDWRYPGWRKLVNTTSTTGTVAAPARWNMLGSDSTSPDTNASALMQNRPDWDAGQWKGVCPDSQRLAGVARGQNRALCTDKLRPGLTTVRNAVGNEANVATDWAPGYSKLQCAAGQMAVGFSLTTGTVNKYSTSKLLCAPSSTALPVSQGRVVWFDSGDNRPAGGGSTASDWAPGKFKGQCADNEYLAGAAFTWKWNHGGVPDALLCKPLA